MAVVSSFPLLRLPKNATMATLRTMDHLELFGISLASKKARDFVRSLKIKASEFTVTISNGFSISLKFSGRRSCVLVYQRIPNRREFSVKYEGIDYRWSLNQMDERTSINHLKVVFNCSKIKVRFGTYSEQFNFEPILKGRQDIGLINLINNNQKENQRILDVIKSSKVYMLRLTSRDLLLENFVYLSVTFMEINLDTLLMMNIRNLIVFNSPVTAKVFNQFLKLWMRGSNPRLESLKLRFHMNNSSDKEELINWSKKTRNDTVRYFKSVNVTRKITGGIDIFRFDGTKATINTDLRYWGVTRIAIFTFDMFVWHDHCVGKETD